ncbi:hypothetical protein GCM10028806_34080 [Spirosoma terrae]
MSKPLTSTHYISPVSPVVTYGSLYARQAQYDEGRNKVQQKINTILEAIEDLSITKPNGAKASHLTLQVFIDRINEKDPDYSNPDVIKPWLDYLTQVRELVRNYHRKPDLTNQELAEVYKLIEAQ